MSILDAAPAVLTFCDTELRVQFANSFAVAWLGRSSRQELLGARFEDLLPPDVYAANLPYARAALDGTPQLFQRSFIDAGGERKHAQAAYTPVRQADLITGFFVHVTDITERIEAEAALREQTRLLARMIERERFSTAFTAVLSRRLYAISLMLSGLRTGAAEVDERVEAAVEELQEVLQEIRTRLLQPPDTTGTD